MRAIKKFCSFFTHVFSFFTKKLVADKFAETHVEEESVVSETPTIEYDDKVNVARRTLLTKLYVLEQEIIVFKNSFPQEHEAFTERIEHLRETYNSGLENVKELLTFEIDPEIDSKNALEVLKLERDIRRFIEREVKFDIISKRLQRLITKLNILYNVSIFHSKEHEKEKVISQLNRALETATKIAREFKDFDYILSDKQLKERIVNLLSYVDYEIFKTAVRNSDGIVLDKLIENLVMAVEFDKFDYIDSFKAFLKDEISDFGELLPLVSDIEFRKALEERLNNLFTRLTISTDNELFDITFWNSFLDFESCMLEMLKVSGVEKEKVKVSIIARMDISLDESDVLVLPMTTTYLSLTSLYSKTQDKRILLMIKLLRNVSNNVTYKEIYFLLLLFDLVEVVTNSSNELARYVKKYFEKYPYDQDTILEKKWDVINSPNKEYVVVFDLNDYEEGIVNALEKLGIDFKIVGKQVLLNSFYFNGLENVVSSLQT